MSAGVGQAQILWAITNMKINSLFPSHPKLEKMLKADYALFGATWWPQASFERLRIATYLSLWVRVKAIIFCVIDTDAQIRAIHVG